MADPQNSRDWPVTMRTGNLIKAAEKCLLEVDSACIFAGEAHKNEVVKYFLDIGFKVIKQESFPVF